MTIDCVFSLPRLSSLVYTRPTLLAVPLLQATVKFKFPPTTPVEKVDPYSALPVIEVNYVNYILL